mmetsp:Transcript_65514/g.207033  ORF Transcript_65514/g.207033 Transcript_65514/m.207033 type:complete len:142 (-) Transcript_65514:89-514(-)
MARAPLGQPRPAAASARSPTGLKAGGPLAPARPPGQRQTQSTVVPSSQPPRQRQQPRGQPSQPQTPTERPGQERDQPQLKQPSQQQAQQQQEQQRSRMQTRPGQARRQRAGGESPPRVRTSAPCRRSPRAPRPFTARTTLV